MPLCVRNERDFHPYGPPESLSIHMPSLSPRKRPVGFGFDFKVVSHHALGRSIIYM